MIEKDLKWNEAKILFPNLLHSATNSLLLFLLTSIHSCFLTIWHQFFVRTWYTFQSVAFFLTLAWKFQVWFSTSWTGHCRIGFEILFCWRVASSDDHKRFCVQEGRVTDLRIFVNRRYIAGESTRRSYVSTHFVTMNLWLKRWWKFYTFRLNNYRVCRWEDIIEGHLSSSWDIKWLLMNNFLYGCWFFFFWSTY